MASVAGIERELRLNLTVQPAELSRVRRDLVERLDSWGYEAVRDDAVLVVTELLSNVHRHAGGRCGLRVTPAGSRLLITVSDLVTAVPARREVSGTAEEGRGLLLVDALTEHWETVLTATGKDIRCSIRLPAPASTPVPVPTPAPAPVPAPPPRS
ncbi:ATP-binding protein [Streptomyces sp. NPDC088554]|uniref:ATP-binding protein n=1 Tax=Streptomyces sp. NPDC088554 TaxID=3365865 RepID=UPI00381FBB99